ncbi:hypothetical protein HOLleu_28683 [Holothuria leucospilota]|uniref:Uncharacterized protein n=1 Tax=Holothuria leucospilota TaxID=206669 RepID=A0A9Q1BMB8_HOLLE|nr:hypothetical protein HOLleu_28683 [Holothuria leucospilota]
MGVITDKDKRTVRYVSTSIVSTPPTPTNHEQIQPRVGLEFRLGLRMHAWAEPNPSSECMLVPYTA